MPFKCKKLQLFTVLWCIDHLWEVILKTPSTEKAVLTLDLLSNWNIFSVFKVNLSLSQICTAIHDFVTLHNWFDVET